MLGIKEISDKTKANHTTLYTWLSGYRFSRYRYLNNLYNVDANFIDDMLEFLNLRYNKLCNKIKNYNDIIKNLEKWKKELTP